SALVGPAALGVDRAHRLHRFRAAATVMASALPAADRRLLEAYAQGVNAGLAALAARPFEYLLLRSVPEPWQVEDTLLVNYAMYLDLNDGDASRDASRALLHESLPAELVQFLLPEGTSWDAPLIGDVWEPTPTPGAGTCDLSTPLAAARARSRTVSFDGFIEDVPLAGSNGWTVAANRSHTGRAIVANDMHLALAVPNIWYRMRWIVAPVDGEPALDVTGVTLPGAPAVVAGSNGSVAWGFTNSYGDWSDLVLLETDPGDPTRYRNPDGWTEIETHDEIIAVRGQEPEHLTVRSTIWGPVLDSDRRGRPRAVRWLAHEPEAVNLRLIDLERARDVDEAIRIAHTIGSPPQNIMLADRDGNTAWTIMGRIPLRAGYDPRLPASWADGGTGWIGWLATEDYPVVKNPPRGFLWTA
ncbi:MAG TPA: penicillin acylase family protein, partial [Gammaproteobacteria bacterium]|nr:penicillin acylase family protein [Gammaproteobacteria bacterium]